MRSMRSLVLYIGLICFLVLCTPTALLAQRQAPPRQFPPPRYIPSHDYDTQNIKLELRFDWEHEQALGTETFTFSPLITDLRRIELDAANMTFNSVKLAAGTPLKFETDAPREKLRITLDRAYQPGETLNLVIDYHTNGITTAQGLAGFGRGLTFIKPNPDDPTRPRQVWSQGETGIQSLLVRLLRSSERFHDHRNHRHGRKAADGDLQRQAVKHERQQRQHPHL